MFTDDCVRAVAASLVGRAPRQASGQAVRNYVGFLRYLRAKHCWIETARLGFEGQLTRPCC